MLKDKNGGGRTGNTQVSKRKASSASASDGNLKKKSKTARDTDKARLSPDGDGETDKEDKRSLAGSNKGSLSPLVKDGDEDEDDAHLDNELFPEEPNFFA